MATRQFELGISEAGTARRVRDDSSSMPMKPQIHRVILWIAALDVLTFGLIALLAFLLSRQAAALSEWLLSIGSLLFLFIGATGRLLHHYHQCKPARAHHEP